MTTIMTIIKTITSMQLNAPNRGASVYFRFVCDIVVERMASHKTRLINVFPRLLSPLKPPPQPELKE